MTQTSTQRHMHEHINKDANKHRKPNEMAQSKQSKHEGSKACYHTKGKGEHVIRHTEGLT